MRYELDVDKIFFLRLLLNYLTIRLADISLYHCLSRKKSLLGAFAGTVVYIFF